MPPDEKDRRPTRETTRETAIQEQAGQPQQIVSDARAAERLRRQREWARGHLDAMTSPRPESTAVDYDAMGFTLGWPERRAAGIALLERERAA